MKVIYTLLIASLLQFLWLAPLKASARSKTAINLAQDKLIQLYDEGMSSIDKEYAEKSHDLSENILKDSIIQQAVTPELKIFKQNITDYLNRYPFHKRYHLYNRLVDVFAGLTIPYYTDNANSTDRKYIKNLMQKLGYEEMSKRYDQELGRFVKEKILKEFTKFAQNLDEKENKFKENLWNWCEKTKTCQNYTCYEDRFNILIKILYTAKDELFDAIYVKVDKINVKYAIRVNKLLQNILKDPKIMELSDQTKQDFIKDIKEFITSYATNNDVAYLDKLLQYFNRNITQKYYKNLKLSNKDQQLLKDIFDRQGFAQIRDRNNYLLNHFIKHDMQDLFENFKNSLTSQELQNEKVLLQWYENVKGLKTFEERKKAFDKLFELHNN